MRITIEECTENRYKEKHLERYSDNHYAHTKHCISYPAYTVRTYKERLHMCGKYNFVERSIAHQWRLCLALKPEAKSIAPAYLMNTFIFHSTDQSSVRFYKCGSKCETDVPDTISRIICCFFSKFMTKLKL